MKNFSQRVFVISSLVICILLIPCFIAAWAEDEGTLGTNRISISLARLFYIFRFPTHTIFWNIFSINGIFFFSGLVINCLFYGLAIERIVQIFKKS